MLNNCVLNILSPILTLYLLTLFKIFNSYYQNEYLLTLC